MFKFTITHHREGHWFRINISDFVEKKKSQWNGNKFWFFCAECLFHFLFLFFCVAAKFTLSYVIPNNPLSNMSYHLLHSGCSGWPAVELHFSAENQFARETKPKSIHIFSLPNTMCQFSSSAWGGRELRNPRALGEQNNTSKSSFRSYTLELFIVVFCPWSGLYVGSEFINGVKKKNILKPYNT